MPKFRRAPASDRRRSLIDATLALIAEQGVQAATVRAIATRAGVTPGLIRHYFASKEELVMAAYAHHMSKMTKHVAAASARSGVTARDRLRAFVTAGLEPPVLDAASVSLWAGFLSMVRVDARMHAIHQRTYYDFRDRLEHLISEALRENGTTPDATTLRRLAIAANAVIDGLWLEGGALPGGFAPSELRAIGLTSVGSIVGLDLTEDEAA